MDHVCRLQQLHVRVYQTCIYMVRVALGIADSDVIRLGQLANGFSQASDPIATSSLTVELLDNFVERAKDLHVSELRVTVQVLVPVGSLCLGIPFQQALYGHTHTANLFSDVLLRLACDDIAVEEVLSNRIHSFSDWPVDDLLLHSPLVAGVGPERQTQIDCIVHVDHCVLAELQLGDEPLQVEDSLEILVEAGHHCEL